MKTNLNTTIYDTDAYFRLSKDDGDKEESDSIINQKALVQEFLKSNPDIRIHEERVDDGYTGVNFERPAFQEMMESIKSGKINCVIVKDLSRFGRNYIEAGRYIEKIFPYLGVRFIAINDNIDTAKMNNGSEDMIIPFKNLINDAYCRDISIKVRSHLDIKRKRGEYIGAFAPYGYKKSEEDKNKLVIDEKAAEIVRQIFQWKIDGMSGARIADKLNQLGVLTPMEYKQKNGENYQCGFRRKANAKWEANGVNRILRSETYTGVLLQGKTVSPNYKVRKRSKKDEKDWIRCEESHEPIISREQYEMVHGLFEEDTRVSPNEEALFLFSGIVKCGKCKGNMTRKTLTVKGKRYVYLVCVNNKNLKSCDNNKSISLEKFEETVLKVINHHIEEVVRVEEMLALIDTIPYVSYHCERLSEEIMDKELEIEKIRQYSLGLYGDYREQLITKEEYLELKQHYIDQEENLKEAIKNLELEKENLADSKREKMDWANQFIEYRGFQKLSRDLLLRLVKEINIYSKDRIEIVFNFQEEYEKTVRFITDIAKLHTKGDDSTNG